MQLDRISHKKVRRKGGGSGSNRKKVDWLEIVVVVSALSGSIDHDNYAPFPATIAAIRERMMRLLKVDPRTNKQWTAFVHATRNIMAFANSDLESSRTVVKRIMAVKDRVPREHKEYVDMMVASYKFFMVDNLNAKRTNPFDLDPSGALFAHLKQKAEADEPPPEHQDSSWGTCGSPKVNRSGKPENMRYACAACGEIEDLTKSPLRRCAGCKITRYCSVECQRKHWRKRHKKDCKKLAENGKTASPSAGGSKSQASKEGATLANPIPKLTLKQLREMSVKGLKLAAATYKVDISSVLEKSDLVERVADAMGIS